MKTTSPHRPAVQREYVAQMVVAASLLLNISCQLGGEPTIPHELTGTWSTSDSRYAGRQLVLGRDTITFGTGNSSTTSYSVQSVNVVKHGVRLLYTVEYRDQDRHEYAFSFYWVSLDSGHIMFKNQSETIWTRSAS